MVGSLIMRRIEDGDYLALYGDYLDHCDFLVAGVKRLNIECSGLTERFFSHLSDRMNDVGLTELRIDTGNLNIHLRKFLGMIVTNRSLEKLTLHNCFLDSEVTEIVDVAMVHPTLKWIDLSENYISDSSMDLLRYLPGRVTSLFLENNMLTDVGAGHLASMIRKGHLRDIGICYNNFTDVGYMDIYNAVKGSQVDWLEWSVGNVELHEQLGDVSHRR